MILNAPLNDVPDQLKVHAELTVDESIAHRSHRAPLNHGMLRSELLRDLLRRLANDLEAAYKSPT